VGLSAAELGRGDRGTREREGEDLRGDTGSREREGEDLRGVLHDETDVVGCGEHFFEGHHVRVTADLPVVQDLPLVPLVQIAALREPAFCPRKSANTQCLFGDRFFPG